MQKEDKRGSSLNSRLDYDLDSVYASIKLISEKHNLSFQQVIESLGRIKDKEKIAAIPSYILRDKSLGILQSVIKYLKEELKFSYHEIASLLNKDERVVWSAHNSAAKKKAGRFVIKDPNHWLPISIFSDKKLSPLQAIALYLREKENCNFSDIGRLLNRDSRTIWACCNNKKEPNEEE
ncbi:hypothetical protein KY366_00465 [Candidatus Woesearchaeota archaeon]|nr:hypothetical protein [Candidatus Woesearchaeota archaeon]